MTTTKARSTLAICRPCEGEALDSWRAFRLTADRLPHLTAVGYEADVRLLLVKAGEPITTDPVAMPISYSAASPAVLSRPGRGTGMFESTLPANAERARERARELVRASASTARHARVRGEVGPRAYGQRAG